MTLVATAAANAKAYDWQTWLIGIMRSFLSGGAVALTTGTGGAVLGIPGRQVWALMGINFVLMGLYRLGEFLTLHGAPEQLAQTLQVAADATDTAKAAIETAKSQVPEKKGE